MSDIKHRCSLGLMPSDIKTSHITQLMYLNQPFDLFEIEAKEAGFDIERHGDTGHFRDHIITLQVRPAKTLVVFTEGGIVKRIL